MIEATGERIATVAAWIAATVAAAAVHEAVTIVPTDGRLALGLISGAGLFGGGLCGSSALEATWYSISYASLAAAFTAAILAYMAMTVAPWCLLELLLPALVVMPAHHLIVHQPIHALLGRERK